MSCTIAREHVHTAENYLLGFLGLFFACFATMSASVPISVEPDQNPHESVFSTGRLGSPQAATGKNTGYKKWAIQNSNLKRGDSETLCNAWFPGLLMFSNMAAARTSASDTPKLGPQGPVGFGTSGRQGKH